MNVDEAQTFDVVVIGGGQAGLAASYYLRKEGVSFVVLDENERPGEAWRRRWDSLRLFTPAAFDGLPGRPFPAAREHYPTKNEMADYLEDYARRFDLPFLGGQKVESLKLSEDGRYVVLTSALRLLTDSVIVATGPYHSPYIPSFASDLDSEIVQLHSSEYRGPEQLPDGDVLVVGAGNSGAEIAYETAKKRATYLSGRDTGSAPQALLGSRLFWWIVGKVTTDTALGKKGREYDRSVGTPLIRLDSRKLTAAGVERVPRVSGAEDGLPKLEDGRVLDVGSVVWATGFKADFGWMDFPIFDEVGYPIHYRGEAEDAPGLFFVGLPYQYTFASAVVGGVGLDAEHVVGRLMEKSEEITTTISQGTVKSSKKPSPR